MKRIFAVAAPVLLGATFLWTPVPSMAARVAVGIGIGVPGPYYYGGPRGYYYGPGYPYYYNPGYYYQPPPTVVVSPPVTVVQEAPASFWYYCRPANAYYPYVRECPVAWQAVPAGPAQQNAEARPPSAAPAPNGKVTYRLGDVLFSTGQSTLQPAALSTLDSLIASINQRPNERVVIEGHTDSVGSAASNHALSQRRADAVMQYMIQHGVPANRISAFGKGEANPIANNATREGRQQNRRVDVTIG